MISSGLRLKHFKSIVIYIILTLNKKLLAVSKREKGTSLGLQSLTSLLQRTVELFLGIYNKYFTKMC